MSTATAIATQPDVSSDLANILDDPKALTRLINSLAPLDEVKPQTKQSVMPAATELPDELKAAIDRLPEVFNSVKVASRRALNRPEQQAAANERDVIDVVIDLLTQRSKALTEIVSTHFDVRAEADGKASELTDRDSKGHYRLAKPGAWESAVLPDGSEWRRQGTGDSADISMPLLRAAVERGEVPKSLFNAITTEVSQRVLDEDKVRACLANPRYRNKLIEALKACTVIKKGTLSIRRFIPKSPKR